MDTPIWLEQAEYQAAERWAAIRASQAVRRTTVGTVLGSLALITLLTMRQGRPEPRHAPLALPPEPRLVLITHTYQEASMLSVPEEPKIDFNAVSTYCSGELGLLCNWARNDEGPAVRCLRARHEALLPPCLRALQLQPEAATD